MEKRKIIKSQAGFSLVEVIMAFTLFSVFITAFMVSQGGNITRSTIMQEDLILHNLCERKLNEQLVDLPKFTNATKNDVKTGNFKQEGRKHYKYKIEFIPLELPSLKDVLLPKEEDAQEGQNDKIKAMIYEKLQKNLEKIVWQLKVTVTNSETKYSYELATWVTDINAEMDTNFGL